MPNKVENKECELLNRINSKQSENENLKFEKCELEKFSEEFEEDLFRIKKDLLDCEGSLPNEPSMGVAFNDALESLQSDGVKMIEDATLAVQDISNKSFQIVEEIDELERKQKTLMNINDEEREEGEVEHRD